MRPVVAPYFAVAAAAAAAAAATADRTPPSSVPAAGAAAGGPVAFCVVTNTPTSLPSTPDAAERDLLENTLSHH